MFAAFTGRSLGFYHAGDVGPGVIASVLGTMALLGIYQRLPHRCVLGHESLSTEGQEVRSGREGPRPSSVAWPHTSPCRRS